MKTATYKIDFFLSFGSTIVWNIGALLFLKFTLDKIGTIAGWDFFDLVLLHAVGQTWVYIYYFFSYPSFKHFGDFINGGELDFLLLKPLNSQLTATFQQVDLTALFAFIQPVAMFAYVFANKSYNFQIVDILMFFISISLTGVIVHLLDTVLCSSVFWFPRSELGRLFYETADVAYYPYEIFQNKFLKMIFFTIFPYALIINIPFRLLINKLGFPFLLLQFAVLLFFLFLSKIVWTAGLKKYQGVSS